MVKKVLITGSNGFIASHVCRYFRENGVEVVGLGRRENSKGNTDAYVQCDLLRDYPMECIKNAGIENLDAVIHLAADMRHEPYTVDVAMTNCGGTEKLLEMCREMGIHTFAQLSSLPVIGKPNQNPITESHSLKPPTVYHVTKVTQEMLAEYANYTFGLQTMSFRISAPVGEGMNLKTIFPVFVEKALKGEDITLAGKGSRKQTYVHVKDIARALYLAVNSNGQGVYNLASHNLLSNLELAQKCVSLLNSQSRIVFSGKPDPMDDFEWDVSLEKIEREIGYRPQVGIDEAILEFATLKREEK